MKQLRSFLTKMSTPASGDRVSTRYPRTSSSVDLTSFKRECDTFIGEETSVVSQSSATLEQSNMPEHFPLSGFRCTPSRCRTAAWAARHDQIVERVFAFAQST